MAFSQLTPPFKDMCGDQDYSKIIREDSEVKMKIRRKKFNPRLVETGDILSSPIFPSNSNAHFKWRIDFYPLGENEDSSGYSSIFLFSTWKKFKTSIPTVMRFEIKTPDNKVVECKELEYTYYDNAGWGLPTFWKVQKMKANFLIIHVQVSAYYEADSNLTSNFLSERTLLRDYSSLLESGEFSDVEISAGGDKSRKYKVHRAILASRSTVFATMLSSNMKEQHTGRIKISDLSSSAIKGMLKFMYSCEVDFTDLEMTLELLEASEKYDLKDLKLQCAEYLTTVLDENNAANILEHAERYGLLDLKKAILEYIYSNKDKFSDSKHFQVILKKNPSLLLEIISTLTIRNDEIEAESD